MIDKITTNRFVVLTPFQEPLMYFMRDYDGLGCATDNYTQYALGTSRSRELEKIDIPADRLSLFAELLNKQTKVFELWKPVLEAANMPNPNKDDYVTDCAGDSWTIVHVIEEFHQNVFTLLTVKKV